MTSSVTAIQETAEAVLGALHAVDWRPMVQPDGNFESYDHASTWFIRGRVGKQVRIEVVRSKLAPVVMLNVEWLNMSNAPEINRGRVTIHIRVDQPKSGVMADTERAVVRCLNIYKDVLEGVGVAGKAALVQKTFSEIDFDTTDG